MTSELNSLVRSDRKQTADGLVIGRLGDGRYRVSIAGRAIRAISTNAGILAIGARVVLAWADDGWAVVGVHRARSRETIEVRRDG